MVARRCYKRCATSKIPRHVRHASSRVVSGTRRVPTRRSLSRTDHHPRAVHPFHSTDEPNRQSRLVVKRICVLRVCVYVFPRDTSAIWPMARRSSYVRGDQRAQRSRSPEFGIFRLKKTQHERRSSRSTETARRGDPPS